MSTTKKLTALFDYQRFEGNKKLQALIDETETRYAYALSDDDLEWVNAAGEIENKDKKHDDDDS